MGLAHDNEGFLKGPATDIDAASYAKHLALLREIRADGAVMRGDLTAIRKQLAKPSPVTPALAQPGRRSSTPVSARLRAQGVPSSPRERLATASPATVASVIASPSRGPRGPSVLVDTSANAQRLAQPRKSNGRFGSGPGAGPGSDAESDSLLRKEKESSTALSDAASALRRGAGEMLAGAGQVDPTVAAAKEVKDIVSPVLGVFKPLGRLFGRRSGKTDAEKAAQTAVPWYRRLWGELRAINKKSGKGGGMMGMLGLMGGLAGLAGLVVRMSGLGLLGKLLSGLVARAGIGAALGGLGGRRAGRSGAGGAGGGGGGGGGRGGLLGKVGKLGKGVLRKLPLIGALMAGGSALYSMFGGGDQTKKERFAGAGSGIGSIIGGAIGALGGPLGIAAGAMLGNVVGEKVGTWLSTVDWDAVGTTISDTWSATADWTKQAFTGAVGYVKESWKTVSDLGSKVFKSVGDWFDEKLGKVSAVATKAATVVRDVRDVAYDKVSQVAAKTADVVKNTANVVTGGAYSGGSRGNKAALVAEMNAQGIKDPKEQAMFLSQMDHESGGFRNYEENLNYSAKGLRKTFGKYYKTDAEAESAARNPEAIANTVYGGRMGNVNQGDGFKYRGRGPTQLTGRDNYTRAGKALGLDLVNNPDLAKDPAVGAKVAAWYWKDRKLGEAGRAGDVTAVTKKINGGTNGLDDRKVKYDQYLAQANSGELTKQSADQSRVAPPVAVTRAIATASAAPRIGPVVSPVTVSAKPISYAPTAPDLVRYAPKAPPSVKAPIASSSKPATQATRIEQPLSQNLGDRNLAAVATGGIGMQSLRD